MLCGDFFVFRRTTAVCGISRLARCRGVLDYMSCATGGSTSPRSDRSTGHTTHTLSSIFLLTAAIVLRGPMVEVIITGHTSANVAALLVSSRTTCQWISMPVPSMDTEAMTVCANLT